MRILLVVTAAVAALAASPAVADDIPCPAKITPELITSLGDPVAWLAPGQTVHAPAGLTMIGQPVSYVIAVRAGADPAAQVTELDYRVKGMNKPYGSRFAIALRQAFAKGFSDNDCSSPQGSCVMDSKASAAGDFSGAELSEGNISLPKDAHGDGLAPVKADYNLDGADPVFLVCHYQPPK
jgi:hypothetical protein